VTKIGELGTTQAATSNRRTLRRNTSNLTKEYRHLTFEIGLVFFRTTMWTFCGAACNCFENKAEIMTES
jgi:hypothetical protein